MTVETYLKDIKKLKFSILWNKATQQEDKNHLIAREIMQKEKHLTTLPHHQAEILKLRYINALTWKEIYFKLLDIYPLSERSIYYEHNKAIDNLRNTLVSNSIKSTIIAAV